MAISSAVQGWIHPLVRRPFELACPPARRPGTHELTCWVASFVPTLLRYGQHLHHAIGVYAVYWLWREVVQYGPLKPYVYGEDEDPHHHGHDADGGHHPAEDAFEAHPKYDHKSLIQQAEDALRDSPTLQMVNDKIKLADD